MEMARICRERFENVKNAYAYAYDIRYINILSYQYKIFATLRSKKTKLENIKNINVVRIIFTT